MVTTERFYRFVDEVFQALWEDDPVFATSCGVHDYDDKLGRMSPEAIEEHVAKLKQFIDRLEGFNGTLQGEEELDRQALLAQLRGSLIGWEDIRWHTKEPALYLDHALYGAYLLIARPFAPLTQRLENLQKRLREFRRLLTEACYTLQPESVPPVYLTIAMETLEGAKTFLSGAIVQAVQGERDERLRRDVLKAVDEAGLALTEFENWLKERVAPKARGSFSIGPDLFTQILRQEHLLTETPDELEAMGREVLETTKRDLEGIARHLDQEKPWFVLAEELKRHHPPRDLIVQTYAEEVEKARQFVIEKGIATLPEGEGFGS